MSAEYFEEQRREMVAAVRAITDHIAADLGKTALDERVLRAMAKVPRHEFVPVFRILNHVSGSAINPPWPMPCR